MNATEKCTIDLPMDKGVTGYIRKSIFYTNNYVSHETDHLQWKINVYNCFK